MQEFQSLVDEWRRCARTLERLSSHLWHELKEGKTIDEQKMALTNCEAFSLLYCADQLESLIKAYLATIEVGK